MTTKIIKRQCYWYCKETDTFIPVVYLGWIPIVPDDPKSDLQHYVDVLPQYKCVIGIENHAEKIIQPITEIAVYHIEVEMSDIWEKKMDGHFDRYYSHLGL